MVRETLHSTEGSDVGYAENEKRTSYQRTRKEEFKLLFQTKAPP